MSFVRLTCSAAAVAALGLLAAQSGSLAQSGVKAKQKTKVESVADQPVISARAPLLAIRPRKSITALTAAELMSLRKGFAQMIAWNNAPRGSANFKRSLRYWANMHSYMGPGCASTSGLDNPGMSGISAQDPTTADEEATWCTCEHGSEQFLTWHRMYLYYFEKVLQAAAGDSTLRLPYWDYETNGHIPAAYRSPTYVNSDGQTVANPLYVANRQADLNSGDGELDEDVVDTSGAMAETSYLPFNDSLEITPHGAVHCATGVASCPSGYMGYVPTAGNDPIFYSHHANIDRLYECWLRVAPAQRLPSGAMLDQTFSFINGAGTLVERRVGDMLTTGQLSYRYTAGGGCPAVRMIRPDLVWRVVPWRTYPLAGPVRLQRGTTVVPLKLPTELRTQFFANAGPDRAPARHARLVIDDIRFEAPPGVMYEVALQGADGRSVTVGVINFFNETAPAHHGRAAPATRRKAFNATAALRAFGPAATEARLVLRPTTGVVGPRVAAANERINPRSELRFGAARLELR